MDPQNLPQNTPIVPNIDPNIGDISEMDLTDITGAYDQMSQGIDLIGQNSLADIAGRQQQLIGNNFGTPAEGPMGNYNENTYISPAVSSGRSTVKQIGTQVALSEGIRRSEEAAEEKLKATQKKYNEWVAEQNRKAAQAQADANAANQAALNATKVQNNTISQETLDKHGLSLEDFGVLDEGARTKLLQEDYERRTGFDWDYKGDDWYATVDKLYKEFGISGSAAKDERSGNQTQANKDFWKRADVSKRFGEIHAEVQGYDDGAKYWKTRQEYVRQGNIAIERWINPKTAEDKAISFDNLMRSIDVVVPTKENEMVEKNLGAVSALKERMAAYERGGSQNQLSQEERDELARINKDFQGEGEANVSRMMELLDKAGSHTRLEEVDQGFFGGVFNAPKYRVVGGEKIVNQRFTASTILESALGLTKEELEGMRSIKQKDSREFERILKIANRVIGGNYMTMSDGEDKPDNYYRDSTGELKLAENGEVILHYMPGAENDPALADLRKYIKDPLYMESIYKATAGEKLNEEEAKRVKHFEDAYTKLRNNQIMAATVAEGRDLTENSDIYSAVLYDADENSATGSNEINGRRISEWMHEFRTLARDDKELMNEQYLDLIDKANRSQGGFATADGGFQELNRKEDGGRSSIGAPRKHFQDLTDEQALALLLVIKKEQDAGQLDGSFLSKHPGADSGIGDNIAWAGANLINGIGAATGLLTGGWMDITGEKDTWGGNLMRGSVNRIIDPKREDVGGAQRYDELAYDTFRQILDVQYNADVSGEEGWYGKDSDFWVGAKRLGGATAGFVADVGLGFATGGAAKYLSVGIARKSAAKIASSYASNLGRSVGESVSSKAIRDASGNLGIRTTAGEFKTFEEIGTDLATAAMNGRGATQYLKELNPAVFKGLDETKVAKMISDSMPKGLMGLEARNRLIQANLRQANANIAGATALMVNGVSSKSIAMASPQALRAAVRIIQQGGKNGDTVFSDASRRAVIDRAEKQIAKLSDELTRGTNAAGKTLSVTEKRSLRGKIAAQKRRIANSGAPSIAREYGFQTNAQVAKKLVDRSAEMAERGRTMSKYEVAKFLSREGSDSARKQAFISRFLRDEAFGNALFVWGDQRGAIDLQTGEHRWEDPGYVVEALVLGSTLGIGIHTLGGPTQSLKRQVVNTRIQRIQSNLLKNAADPTNKAYVRQMNKLARLTRQADRLMDDALTYAGNPDAVALFKRSAEDAKVASRQVLDALQEVKGFSDTAMAKSAKELTEAVMGKANYENRLVSTMTMLRGTAHNDYVTRTAAMRNIAGITDEKANAAILKSGFDSMKAARAASKKPLTVAQADKAMDAGLVEGLVKYGINRETAEREIRFLRSEYKRIWKEIEAKSNEGVIELKSFGGSDRGGYISPAGITHTMVDDMAPSDWGLIFERKVNADISEPIYSRQADMGETIDAWINGKRHGKGIMKVRNPEGFNLLTGLHTYSNVVNSRLYLATLDHNIIKNGDMLVVGSKNIANAISEDRKFYTDRAKQLKAEIKALKAETRSAAEGAQITAKRAEVQEIETRLSELEGVGLNDETVRVAAETLNTTQKEFSTIYRRIANGLYKNKQAILKGGEGDARLNQFTDGRGNYTRDNVLEATFRHFDNVQPLYDVTGGAGKEAKSQYMRGVDDVVQATLRHRVGDTDYSKSLVNEARRHFAETDAGSGIYGLGDVVQYVAERVPLSKKPGDGLDSLEWRDVSNALTRSKADEALSTVKADYEPGSAIRTLAEALDEPRGTQVRLRGSEADLEADMYGEALEYRLTKMEEFERFSTAEKQEALDALEFLLREGSEKGPAKKSETTLNRQFNLQEIVAKNNLDDPNFDESPMFSRITDPETPQPTQPDSASAGLQSAVEDWERQVDELLNNPSPEILDEVVELTGGDYSDWADVPLEVKRDIVEAEIGPKPTVESETPGLAPAGTKELEDQLLVNHYNGRKSEMVKEWEKANPAPDTDVETDYLDWEIKRDNYVRELTQAEDRIYAKLILKKTDDPRYENYALSAAERDLDEGVESWISGRGGEELDAVSQGYSRDDLPPGWNEEMWDEMEAINNLAAESQSRNKYGSMTENIRSYSRDLEHWAKSGPGSIKNPREAVLAYAELALKSENAPAPTPTPTWSNEAVDLGTVKIGKKSVPAAALTENGIIMPGAPAAKSGARPRTNLDDFVDQLESEVNSIVENVVDDENARRFLEVDLSQDLKSGVEDKVSEAEFGSFDPEFRAWLRKLDEAEDNKMITSEQKEAILNGREGEFDGIYEMPSKYNLRTVEDEFTIDWSAVEENEILWDMVRYAKARDNGRGTRLPESTIPRTPGARLGHFYRAIGSEAGLEAEQKALRASLRDAKKELNTMVKAKQKAAIESANDAAKPLMRELVEVNEKLGQIKAAGRNPEAYINRNGLRYVANANGLQGYSSAQTLTDLEVAKRQSPGIRNVLENSSIRRDNKRKGAVTKATADSREAAYKELTGTVRSAGSVMDDSDIMIHQSLAKVRSVEHHQFSTKQTLDRMLLATSGFAKAVQNVQLSAGFSRYNAYSFRFLLSALMSDPRSAGPLLKTLRESRSIESVNEFYIHNQELFIDVAHKTGDPYYMQLFSDSVSQSAEFDTGYLARLVKAPGRNARYVEKMDRIPRERRKELAEAQGLDSWRNTPTHEATTAVAVEASAPRRLYKTIANAVETTFDDPTFKRYIPVLAGTMYMQNYRRAIEIAKVKVRKHVTAQAKREGREVEASELMLTQDEIDFAIMQAHVRTKLFFHPISTSGMGIKEIKRIVADGSYDEKAIDAFFNKLKRDQIDEITGANDGKNMGKIIQSLFFALAYKATQLGQIVNGVAGIGQLARARVGGQGTSLVLEGSRNMVGTMLGLTAAAIVYNEVNGRPQGWDDPARLLTNLNELGKFRLGDGDGTPAIDPYFSQFTLLNSSIRMVAGLAGMEGGSGVGKSNPHRGIGIPGTSAYIRGNLPFRLGAIQDELTANLLSPFKAVAEVMTNNTYFGGNIWEHPTKLDGTPNKNYDPLRNLMASAWHLMGFDTTNAMVKGENLEDDDISWIGGSGLVQHPYLSAFKSWQKGDYAAAMFEALEMPIKWDNLPGRAKSSLNGYVVDTIGQLKQDYDAVVAANEGNKDAIDAAYESYTKQSVQVISEWSKTHGDVLENDPRLVAAAQRIMTGFFADQYDDNLMKMQSAYWRASIESGLGTDFGWHDMMPHETEDQFLERKEKTTAAFFAERDKEYEARKELERLGFDTGDRWASDDDYTTYRGIHRNVISQFESLVYGKVEGYYDLRAEKKNYEERIKLVDSVYTNEKKALERKTQMAEEHNQKVFDILRPYVEQYGPYTLEMYDRSGGKSLGSVAAELLIIPADQLWKYALNKTPERNYLKDQFGVGYRNNSNLPSDPEYRRKFEQVNKRMQKGQIASASTLLNDIIKSVQSGKYGVTGQDWTRTLRYREIINGRMGL